MTGLVHIYCGDGKGKTTAAAGLCLRCAGNGKRVLFIQFLKSRDSGEILVLREMPSVTVRRRGAEKFVFQMDRAEKQQEIKSQTGLLLEVIEEVKAGDYDMLVLDEVFGALSVGMIDQDTLLDLIKNKPRELELVLTGRDPAPVLLEQADYVSEIMSRKHPYDRGIPARKGIEM